MDLVLYKKVDHREEGDPKPKSHRFLVTNSLRTEGNDLQRSNSDSDMTIKRQPQRMAHD